MTGKHIVTGRFSFFYVKPNDLVLDGTTTIPHLQLGDPGAMPVRLACQLDEELPFRSALHRGRWRGVGRGVRGRGHRDGRWRFSPSPVEDPLDPSFDGRALRRDSGACLEFGVRRDVGLRVSGQGYRAPWAEPLPVRDFRQRWVEAVNVVGGGAGVAAQQLAAVFANSAEFHVVVVLLLGRRPSGHAHPHAELRDDPFLAVLLEILKVLVFGLPLDSLFLLRAGDIIDVEQSD